MIFKQHSVSTGVIEQLKSSRRIRKETGPEGCDLFSGLLLLNTSLKLWHPPDVHPRPTVLML